MFLICILFSPTLDNMVYDGESVVEVKYVSERKMKVIIQKGEDKTTHSLVADGDYKGFPLTLGNGEYEILLLENTEGIKYKMLESKTIQVDTDDKDVYLNSIQNIDWEGTVTADISRIISKGMLGRRKVLAIYLYLVRNMGYDYEKMKTVGTDYVPNLDTILLDEKGMCYDYATMFAGMLRSIGVPCKVVKGYKNGSVRYHSWNEVYLDKWVIIDVTHDSMSKDYKMIKDNSTYNKVNEY